jgi:hypothetical protein
LDPQNAVFYAELQRKEQAMSALVRLASDLPRSGRPTG